MTTYRVKLFRGIIIQFCCLLSVLFGFSSITAWLLDIPILASFLPAKVPMAMSTAVLFIIYGVLTFIQYKNISQYKFSKKLISINLFGILLALVLFILSINGIHPEIEHLGLNFSHSEYEKTIGHISPLTALCFLFIGFSFFTIQISKGKKFGTLTFILSVLIVLVSAMLILAYLFGIPILYQGEFVPPALSTSIALLFLGIALLLECLEIWIYNEITDVSNIKITFNLVIVLIIIIVGIVSAGYLYYKNYEKQYRTEMENQLRTIADMKAGQLVQWRNERLEGAASLFDNESFTGYVNDFLKNPFNINAKRQIQIWLKKFQTVYHYNSVILSDTLLIKRIIVPETEEQNKSFISKENLEALKSGKILFQDFYKNQSLQKIFLKLLIPIFSDKNSKIVIGIIELRIDPETYLYPLISQWPSPSRTSETLIVRREDSKVVFLNDLKYRKNAPLALKIPLYKKQIPAVQAVLGYRGIVNGIDYRSVKVIAYVREVPASPWFIVARMDLSEVYEPLQDKLWSTIFLVLGFILFSVASIGLIWRKQQMQSDAKFRLLFDNMEEGVALHKLEFDINNIPNDYRIIEVNKSFEQHTGIKNETAGGKLGTVIYQMNPPPFFNEYVNVALTSMPFSVEVYFEPLKRYFHIEAVSQGKGYFATIFSDITVRKKAERDILMMNTELEQRVIDRTIQLENVNKELESFAYSVAHDLRSPLRAIDGFSKIIYDEYFSKLDDEGKRLLNVIINNTKKMDNLITDLLALSKVTRSDFNISNVNMRILTDSIYNELATNEIKDKFTLIIHTIPDANCDTILIRQLWNNLISNAIKYTMPKQDCRIEIGYEKNKTGGYYYIKDNGVGFNPEYKHKLFGVFQRLHTANEFEGTGVGLAIVKRIIQRHGGEVWAEGNLNEGATFYFTIPGIEL